MHCWWLNIKCCTPIDSRLAQNPGVNDNNESEHDTNDTRHIFGDEESDDENPSIAIRTRSESAQPSGSSGQQRETVPLQNDANEVRRNEEEQEARNKRKKTVQNGSGCKRARRAFGDFKMKLPYRWKLQARATNNAEMTRLREELARVTDKLKGAECELKNMKTKSRIPDFLPNIKTEIEFAESRRTQAETTDMITMDELKKQEAKRILHALAKDANIMVEKNIQKELEDNEIAQEYMCCLTQDHIEFALIGPDGFHYDKKGLLDYIKHNHLFYFASLAPDTQVFRLLVKEWKSPNTREVFSCAYFSVDHAANNVLFKLHRKIANKVDGDFRQHIVDARVPSITSMADLISFFKKDEARE